MRAPPARVGRSRPGRNAVVRASAELTPPSAGIEASLSSTGQTPAMEEQQPGAHSDDDHRTAVHHAVCLASRLPFRADPDRHQGASCLGRNPSYRVPNNRGERASPSACRRRDAAWCMDTSALGGAGAHRPLRARAEHQARRLVPRNGKRAPTVTAAVLSGSELAPVEGVRISRSGAHRIASLRPRACRAEFAQTSIRSVRAPSG
jgi:hypothetical protein